MLWKELKSPDLEALAQRNALVVLPCGSIEQHGRHLPVDTDSSIVTAVAEKAAAQMEDVLLLPTLWYGLSPHHMGAGGTITLSHATYSALIRDIVMAVDHHGFKQMVLLNGHGGNDNILKGIVLGMQNEVSLRLLTITYWYLIEPDQVDSVREGEIGSMGHGGELETSIQLHLRGHLVDTATAEANVIKPKLRYLVRDLFYPGHAVMIDGTQRGKGPFVMGDPGKATAEKGEALLNFAGDNLAAFLEEFRALS